MSLISFFSCAPTTIETIKKTEKKLETDDKVEEIVELEKSKKSKDIKIEKPTKPENKDINFKNIENILVVLSDDKLLSSIFYEVFTANISKYNNLSEIKFIHSVDEITETINNTILIGPINSEMLVKLPPKLGENTFILSLSNDYSLMNKFADNEIIFIPNSPYHHVEELKNYINSSETVGVLYKQNDYGLKIFTHFKKTNPLIYTKSSSYGSSAIDLELSVNLLGNLDEIDKIVIIDDTLSYKDLIGYLATDEKIYPLDKIYLIDNFLEQRKNLENYYMPLNRTSFNNIDLTSMSIPHREYLFEKSVEISLMLADKIVQKDTIPKKIVHPDLGELLIYSQMIDYPIIFD